MLQYIRNFWRNLILECCSGPVCPFMPKSLRKDALHVCCALVWEKCRRDARVRRDIISFLETFALVFSTMEPNEGAAQQFKAAVFMFPDITLDQTELALMVCRAHASPFRAAAMLGEFHLRNNSPGLRNKNSFRCEPRSRAWLCVIWCPPI